MPSSAAAWWLQIAVMWTLALTMISLRACVEIDLHCNTPQSSSSPGEARHSMKCIGQCHDM
eukprot:6085432-Amphidinium_carterae.1